MWRKHFPNSYEVRRFRVCNSRNLRASFFGNLISLHTQVVRDIWEESDDHGRCRFAVVQTYGDTTHTFIERQNYKGIFLPGYKKPRQKVVGTAQSCVQLLLHV